MPHSGGGGSHSGGSHHSSSHSSHGSHGGSGSSYRKSYTPFTGSRTFVYYRDNQPHFYYATRRESIANNKLTGIVFLVMAVCILFVGFLVPAALVTVAKGPIPTNYDTTIVIEDNVGLIEAEDVLQTYLEGFLDRTGVSVAVITQKTDECEMGSTVEVKAYNTYVSRWQDESHWLIYYVGDATDRSDDWQWNLMCGNDCVSVLSYDAEDEFTDLFHRRLVDVDDYSFEAAVMESLDLLDIDTGKRFVYRPNTTVNGNAVGGTTVDSDFYILPVTFGLVGLFFLFAGIICVKQKPTQKQLDEANAYEVKDAVPKQEACEYCGGTYVVGTVGVCPYCGAPLKVYSSESDW